jgi:hypothetical protein
MQLAVEVRYSIGLHVEEKLAVLTIPGMLQCAITLPARNLAGALRRKRPRRIASGQKKSGFQATLNRRTISSSTSTPNPGPVGTGIMPSTISIDVVHSVLSKDAEETLNSR